VDAFTAQTLAQNLAAHSPRKVVKMVANHEKTVQEHELHEEDEQDVEKAFLEHELAEHKAYPQKSLPPGLSRKFWVFAAINTLSTAGIVSLSVAHLYMQAHY
jgi:aminopeptidase C